jgi:nitroimidazol reductase NimA-like FMN-containing flavoprotein (pyridoxamine 5'-phosphate oxidase superfamily)
MTSRGLDVLTTEECLDLLRQNSFGRVGLKIAEDLTILPVYYASAGDDIVFRTDPGTKLIAAVLDTRVAFEVDDRNDGWSVLVTGHAHEVRAESDAADARERLDQFWADGNRERVVRIEIERITGRRLQPSLLR